MHQFKKEKKNPQFLSRKRANHEIAGKNEQKGMLQTMKNWESGTKKSIFLEVKRRKEKWETHLKEGIELRKRSIQEISVGVGLRGLSEGNL